MKGPGLLVVVLVVLGGVSGLGFLLGLGNAATLAALTALFCLIAAVGGPLWADLRLLAWFAPAMVLAVGVPRLLGAVSQWAAIGLLVVIVVFAGLLPALGARFVTVGLGLGMASLFGYGFQLTGTASAGQVLGAPALAVGVVLLLRVLMGAKDPAKPTRDALADALAAGTSETQERAARLWLADRPRRWTAGVLGGMFRYRAATGLLEIRGKRLDNPEIGETLDAAREEATRLADAVRSARAPEDVEPVRRKEPAELPGATARLVTALWDSLETVRAAATERDESRVDVPKGLRNELRRIELSGAFSWQSPQFRHAIRCGLGVALALVVASFRPGDPLTVSFLLGTFAIMQPEWRDSLSKAWQRIGGSLGGAVVLTLVLWLLPQGFLLPIGLVALLGGFSVMRTRPAVFNGCMVLMSVGMNATTRHLDPRYVLVEYLLLMVLAGAIALLFGFAAIPGVPKPGPAERFGTAVGATRALLGSVGRKLRGEDVDPRTLGREFRAAAIAHHGLLAAEPGTKEPAPGQRDALENAAEALRGLSVTASSLLLRPGTAGAANAVEEAARTLGTEEAAEIPVPRDADEEQRLVLDTIAADVVSVGEAAQTLKSA
ncbi:FUSC family protein [Amycolatopsis sp. BJA-103]|uniref:FUSC family protein n=1 Tax=Amycolatopsis sp. BJA-103 TaxID=1911175 RepID=UPI000C76213D|nr:FUSC family protein [Amycolatopsis sp. BJA-103]AUI60510.1 FUSC family protein [Amycolatopsis sp. BJA-103]PNE16535.1 FUSC family protein [Amycolatopsis sp. BJA-103]